MAAPRLFDSHAHVNFTAFQADWQVILDDCQKQRVWVMVVGSQLETSRRAVEMAEAYAEGVYAAVGLHPVHVSDQPEPFRVDDYARLLADSPKVVAVGETGVDYYRLPPGRETEELQRQREVFTAQLRLARDSDKALVMHTREHPTGPRGAYADLLFLLERERAAGLPRGVIHCFLGTLEEARAFTRLGFYIGVTGILTFGKKAEQLRAVVQALPLERLLIETDCPYLSPEPHRGQRNVPPYVAFVAATLARCRDESPEAVAAQTTQNARQLYRV